VEITADLDFGAGHLGNQPSETRPRDGMTECIARNLEVRIVKVNGTGRRLHVPNRHEHQLEQQEQGLR
jgi:hypothetical protein